MFSFSDILGINARHLLYIKKYNGEEATSFADNKLKTKRFLEARKIPVPKLLGVIRTFQELDNFLLTTLPGSIVLKPNSSSGGEGIVVLVEKNAQGWIKANGESFTREQFYRHCSEILAGAFSKTGQKDICIIERRIISHEKLEAIAYKGLPDIRIIVLNMVPVMAMLRLPTKASDGKANMHMGGIGAGIDLAKGEITYLTQYNKSIDEIPEVGDIRGYKIPHWDEILTMAVKTQMITGVGYLGVDIALDKTGPLLLEMNARAGLGIQIANMAPLRKRLQMVEKLKVKSIEKGIRIAKDLFGRQIDRDIENLSGKKVIGTKEYIKLFFKEGTRELLAKIDPIAEENLLEESIFEQLYEMKPHLRTEDKGLRIKCSILEDKTKTIFKRGSFSDKEYQVVLGRRQLKGFLIDPYKYKKTERPEKEVHFSLESLASNEKKLKEVVETWMDIDKTLLNTEKLISKNFSIRPLNYKDELIHFVEAKGNYNPKFIYKTNNDAYPDIKKMLESLKINTDVVQGKIYYDKKEELLTKLDLYYQIGKDAHEFSRLSEKYFLPVNETHIAEAKEYIEKNKQIQKIQHMEELLHVDAIQKKIYEYFKKYKLKKWNILLKEDIAARISVAKSNKRHLYLSKQIKLTPTDLIAVLAHEVETHVLRLENGLKQPYTILHTGTAGYLTTEEGLAIYNQEQVLKNLGLTSQWKENNAAQNYLKTVRIISGSFQAAGKIYEKRILRTHIPTPKDYENIFRKVFRVKRGLGDTSQIGGNTKDLSYFAGFQKVNQYIKNGGDIRYLYYGKISIECIADILCMEELVEPKLFPDFLNF